MASKYKVSVDESACMGCGSCVAAAPKTFEMNENNKASVKSGEHDSDETILQTAQICPVQAIHITDESGKKVFPKE